MGKSGLKDATYFVTKRLGRAASGGEMLENDQRVVVAVSGGPMSTALLYALVVRSRRLPIRNIFSPVYVPDGAHGPDQQVIGTLQALCRDLRVELHVAGSPLGDADRHGPVPHVHRLLGVCRDLRAHVLALAHTAEDCALELLASMGMSGEVRRLPPVENLGRGTATVKVIRPLWLLTQPQVSRMNVVEGLNSADLVWKRPGQEYRDACMEFLLARRVDLVEQLRNITLSPENVSWDYLV